MLAVLVLQLFALTTICCIDDQREDTADMLKVDAEELRSWLKRFKEDPFFAQTNRNNASCDKDASIKEKRESNDALDDELERIRKDVFHSTIQLFPADEIVIQAMYSLFSSNGVLKKEGFTGWGNEKDLLHSLNRSAGLHLTSLQVAIGDMDPDKPLIAVANYILSVHDLNRLKNWLTEKFNANGEHVRHTLQNNRTMLIIEYYCCSQTNNDLLKPYYGTIKVKAQFWPWQPQTSKEPLFRYGTKTYTRNHLRNGERDLWKVILLLEPVLVKREIKAMILKPPIDRIVLLYSSASDKEMEDEEYKELLIPKEESGNLDEKNGANKGATYSVEEAIEKMGFGMFQVKLLALCGVSWVVFIGMFLSTYLWGYMSDKYGRKPVIILATLGIFYYGLVSSISPRYFWIVLLRGMVGFSMSGVVQGTNLIAEFLPMKTRGLTINLSSCFWSIGTSIEILTAMFVMPSLGWRWQLFFSALPSLLFLSIAKILPESARFYATSGQPEKAMEILESIAKNNKAELPAGKLEAVKVVANRGSMVEMFKGGLWKTTVLLWVIWFGSHFNIYGLALLTTALYSSGYECYGSSPIPAEDITNCDYCKKLDKTDYLNFFFVLSADFLCVLIVALLADTVGRKWLQGIGFFMMGIFFSLLFICTHSQTWTTLFLFGARCFAAVADIGGYIYTPEVYPTHIRGIALGSCSGISRIGCMLTPFISQVLAHKSIHLTIAIYVGVSFTGFICCLLLPIETKGRHMIDINKES
eukprot:gene14313-15802_t